MPSCLGLYIETNIIKYAKVSKERDILKIESFGIKFYDKLDEAIKQIISETYSFKIFAIYRVIFGVIIIICYFIK